MKQKVKLGGNNVKLPYQRNKKKEKQQSALHAAGTSGQLSEKRAHEVAKSGSHFLMAHFASGVEQLLL